MTFMKKNNLWSNAMHALLQINMAENLNFPTTFSEPGYRILKRICPAIQGANTAPQTVTQLKSVSLHIEEFALQFSGPEWGSQTALICHQQRQTDSAVDRIIIPVCVFVK